MRILVIEDEKKIADNLKKGLQQESYAVDVVYDGESGYDLASTEEYDVILLDRMLPKMDGMELCQKLRQEENTTPILMLTAKGEIEDKVEGLDSGADDYLAKPFSFEELLARIRALSRRPAPSIGPILKVADLQLDPAQHTVIRSGKDLKLSPKEFSLLDFLMRNTNQIVSKEQIHQHVWEFDSSILPNTIEVYIGYLRSKVDKPFPNAPSLIHTVRGFGYKLSPNP